MEKNYKELALTHVRDVCSELRKLSFGCWVRYFGVEERVVKEHPDKVDFWRFESSAPYCDLDVSPNDASGFKIIGHTPHLEHWLRGMGIDEATDVYVHSEMETLSVVQQQTPRNLVAGYDLTKDGENQSEEFYKAYCEIVGI